MHLGSLILILILWNNFLVKSNASSEMPPKDSKTMGRYKCPSEMILDWKQSYLTSWAYLLHAKVKVCEEDRTYFCWIGQVHAKSTTSPLPAVKLGMKMSAGRSEEKGIRKVSLSLVPKLHSNKSHKNNLWVHCVVLFCLRCWRLLRVLFWKFASE